MDDQILGLDSLLEGEFGKANRRAEIPVVEKATPWRDVVIAELYFAAADMRRRPSQATLIRIAGRLEELARALERGPVA